MRKSLVILSGGQTGVDRAALDVAIELAIPYEGYCPRGGWAEDLTAPPGLLARYPNLRETSLADPAQRTEWNVRAADAVLILTGHGGLAASQGTARAHDHADRGRKPLLTLSLDAPDAIGVAGRWLDDVTAAGAVPAPLKLGIGGPRESEVAGIYDKARQFLRALLAQRVTAPRADRR
jgi:hypothetical protein